MTEAEAIAEFREASAAVRRAFGARDDARVDQILADTRMSQATVNLSDAQARLHAADVALITVQDKPETAFAIIDAQTCEPVDATLRAFQDDHIVEPQPTEGYAPVVDQPATNPEADFWARGLAPSEPEKKHRFSIFGHKRETEDA